MLFAIHILAWLACVVYSTIPSFWLLIHPRIAYWRSRARSPYLTLVPVWITMWIAVTLLTSRWRQSMLYATPWTWLSAALLFAAGFRLYFLSAAHFTPQQLAGVPELRAAHRDQRLVTTGIRARIRHPVYLAHLCEMMAWSVGSGLTVCFVLTVFAIATGAAMIGLEDKELEQRFGAEYAAYRNSVPAVIPRLGMRSRAT